MGEKEQSREHLRDELREELRRRNVRTGLILASIALLFVLGLVAKRTWFM